MKLTLMFNRTFVVLVLTSFMFGVLTSCGSSDAKTATADSSSTATSESIKLGFIPLTDCASLVMAQELGLFKKYGVKVELSKEASWANVRDKILTGELAGAHCLFGMPFSVFTGIGGKAGSVMKIAMILNNNGQAITLSNKFCDLVGNNETAKVKSAVDQLNAQKQLQFAMTFPGGTHDIWLRYWLAATGVDAKKVGIKTIPPPQMVANMKVDNMDGFCVGEPWNGVAVKEGIGFTHIASQDIWKNHPEKALVVNEAFAGAKKDDLKKVMKAVIEASIWLDSLSNRKKAAEILSQTKYVNAPAEVIEARLMGTNNTGCKFGDKKYEDYMKFFNNGLTNAPRKSYGIWFMSQYVRFGLLSTPPSDYKSIADKIIMSDLYKEVAGEMKLSVADDDMQPFTVTIDKAVFDPNHVDSYLAVAKK
ncbi:ABC transporter substrate-binding protein [Chitinophagaceae bacterium LB-8]|uniref:ABC transporter substrate-binding protein n=1 Tax=Paraflavisolibacter caeni TaxID=2982496 RepID=A0A9X2XPF8_9BACT|nr:CmpA/NrtA family ABC transporter substrate-binding protein [Paraflavisolibacter caeni]MCU7550769.1 ABC transporter substrate-binding protein [Paraflavisolibacter caeni]